MKKEEIRKEILTYANIRRDLWRRLWRSWILLLLCVAFIVVFIWSFHQIPELLFRTEADEVPGWLFLLSIPFLLYVVIKQAWAVACGFRRKLCITKDTLHASEGDRYYSRHNYRTYYCTLHFNGYGDYAVPEENYRWSKEYPMTARGVHNTSFDGDEFYLVLSKPHSGKVLLAYPAKYFTLEE